VMLWALSSVQSSPVDLLASPPSKVMLLAMLFGADNPSSKTLDEIIHIVGMEVSRIFVGLDPGGDHRIELWICGRSHVVIPQQETRRLVEYFLGVMSYGLVFRWTKERSGGRWLALCKMEDPMGLNSRYVSRGGIGDK